MPADAAAVQAVARAAAWALVHFVWQGAALWLALLVVRAATRGASPRARYACACVGLAAMALAPVWTVARIVRGERSATRAVAAAVERASPAGVGGRAREERAGAVGLARVASPLGGRARETVARWERAAGEGVTTNAPLILAAWAVGVLALSARLGGGVWLALRLARAARAPAPEGWDARLARLRQRLRVAAPVRLAESSLVHVPSVIGWLRPVILVPVGAFTGLPPAELELLLAHELAHVRRHDWLVNVAQSAVETLLFFHPTVWRVSAWVREEREHCCDDVAAAVAPSPLAYVRALAGMEVLRAAAPAPLGRAPALSLGADGGPLLRRVARLAGGAPARPGLAMLLAGVVPLGALGAAVLWSGPRVHAAGAFGARPPVARDASPRLARAVDSAAAALLARVGSPGGGLVVVQDVRSGAVVARATHAPAGGRAPDVGAAAVPASVWKLTLAATWWDAGLGDATEPCTPRLRVGGHAFTGWPGAAGSRPVTPREMLAISCTTAAARMALRLRDTLGMDGVRAAYARLGRALDVPDLRVPEDDGAWAALAVGSAGVRVSPLHVARLLQAIGNDGVALAAPGAGGVRVMRAGTARRLREAMLDVVRVGTASAAAPRLAGVPWTLGGKTGTVSTPGGAREDGWFAGLAFDAGGAPRYVVLVRLDGAGPGGGAPALLAAALTRVLAGTT